MRLGILKADAVLPQLATRFGEYPDMFQRVLSSADPSLRYQVYDVEHGPLPGSLDECDGWLVTGSRRSVSMPPTGCSGRVMSSSVRGSPATLVRPVHPARASF